MTPELIYLALTALLVASLWIPYIVGVNVQKDVYAGDFTRPMSPNSRRGSTGRTGPISTQWNRPRPLRFWCWFCTALIRAHPGPYGPVRRSSGLGWPTRWG